jgi:uncharacterized protein YndB with AHSA1/START domain
MPVRKDPDGRRSVEAEVEVPGTPEEVWKAIATGHGISSWFVPTQVDEREGGHVAASFGPGMDSSSTIKVWNPPHNFIAESRDDMGPDDPTIATEWIVEARAGGKCVVRVVHSWFTSKDDWDQQFEGHTHGWRAFFRILRVYLAHFPGQPCTAFQLMGITTGSQSEAWATLTGSLGLSDVSVGQSVRTLPGAPALAGLVESAGPAEHPELLLRLSEPADGAAHLFAMPMGGSIFIPVRIYLYGDRAPAAAAKAEPEWAAWLNGRFPAAQ